MIFLPNNRDKSSSPAPAGQSGVTLLLATLVLSAIAAISFSLAAITFVEIQVSNDLSKTEPALYAVTALTEQAIFQVKRAVPIMPSDQSYIDFGACSGTNCTTTNPTAINGVALKAFGLSAISPSNNVTDVVKSSSNSLSSTKNIYTLYDASAPYVGSPSGYSQVIITYVSTNPSGTSINSYLCESSQDCLGTGAWTSGPFGLNAASTSRTFNLDPAKAYQLYLVNTSGLSAKDVTVNIQSFGPGNVSKGLPYFGKQSVQISASFQGLTRKYQIFVPNQ